MFLFVLTGNKYDDDDDDDILACSLSSLDHCPAESQTTTDFTVCKWNWAMDVIKVLYYIHGQVEY